MDRMGAPGEYMRVLGFSRASPTATPIVVSLRSMPFTLSHAGLVLPFCRRLSSGLILALLIGALSPDFGYFLRLYSLATFSHTLTGLLVVVFPVSWLLYYS